MPCVHWTPPYIPAEEEPSQEAARTTEPRPTGLLPVEILGRALLSLSCPCLVLVCPIFPFVLSLFPWMTTILYQEGLVLGNPSTIP